MLEHLPICSTVIVTEKDTNNIDANEIRNIYFAALMIPAITVYFFTTRAYHHSTDEVIKGSIVLCYPISTHLISLKTKNNKTSSIKINFSRNIVR